MLFSTDSILSLAAIVTSSLAVAEAAAIARREPVATFKRGNYFESRAASTSSSSNVTSASSSYELVNTTYGAIQGTNGTYRDGVIAYKGIPFAAPPLADLRWKAPQDQYWNTTLVADTFGYECPQSAGGAAALSSGYDDFNEDCLTLNIWRPNSTASDLPVYLWIHGGRFSGGSGIVPTYNGEGLAVQDIIVVNMNYRLGPLGFLASSELDDEAEDGVSGNYGVLDMIKALDWVHSEIENFGGNSSQITVGGQSSGSASSLAMMWSPLSRDKVAGIVAESGIRGVHDPLTGSLATSYRNKTEALEFGEQVYETMNVTTIAEMRALNVSDLISELDNLASNLYEGTQFINITTFLEPPEWRPVIDSNSTILPYNYSQSLSMLQHADVPVLSGNNADESGASVAPGMTVDTYTTQIDDLFSNYDTNQTWMTLWPANTTDEANNQTNILFRDYARVSSWSWSNLWTQGGAKSKVYTYFWNHTPGNQTDEGAYHGSELFFAFNNVPYSADYVTWYEDDLIVQTNMTAYWANFIKSGDPNGDDLATWEASTEEGKQTMWLGDKFGMGNITETEEKREYIDAWWSNLQAY